MTRRFSALLRRREGPPADFYVGGGTSNPFLDKDMKALDNLTPQDRADLHRRYRSGRAIGLVEPAAQDHHIVGGRAQANFSLQPRGNFHQTLRLVAFAADARFLRSRHDRHDEANACAIPAKEGEFVAFERAVDAHGVVALREYRA